ncbi:MAG: DUF349 domain-containing protein [Erysipelothrix sp.]|nr:DUF349 domain-containing protein [Erysipelothrix sp.]
MDKTDINVNNAEEAKEEKSVEETEHTASEVVETKEVETQEVESEVVETQEVETQEVEAEVVETKEVETKASVETEKPAKKVAPRRREYRQPSYRSNNQFGWESLDTVQDERKQELIQEIFDLSGEENEEKIEEIQEEWEMIHDEGTDKRLETRFERALERHTASQEAIDEAIAIKTDLLRQAEEMKESTRWNKTADKYKSLQKEWRNSGWAGDPDNDELWDKFQAVNDHFFNRRKEHFDQRVERIQKAAEIKAELVEKVKEYEESTEWKSTSAVMHQAMDDWKAAGFAGRGTDDKLWAEFNESRQKFFQRQNEHFEGLRQKQKDAFDTKTNLVELAQELQDSTDWEPTRIKMEEFMEEWREAGYSGRKHDNSLWEAFQGARDVFYKNFHSQQSFNKEGRLEEIETELENVNAQIDSLELLNETIIAKYDNLLNRALPAEDHESFPELNEAKEKELSELQGYITNNNKSINEHFDTLDRLNNELDKLNR